GLPSALDLVPLGGDDRSPARAELGLPAPRVPHPPEQARAGRIARDARRSGRDRSGRERRPLIPLEDIRAAAARIAGLAVRTPLLRLHVDDAPAEIYLKLENLQPIGSFKIRGAGNAMRTAPREALGRGVYTASAGNMAQGVAWVARELGVRCDVLVPDHAPQTKLDAITRLGGHFHKLPFSEWWRVLEEHGRHGMEGYFVHPVSHPAVMAGNGTIGLEVLADLPDVDAVLVPFGGGGLSCGIASAVRALRPE